MPCQLRIYGLTQWFNCQNNPPLLYPRYQNPIPASTLSSPPHATSSVPSCVRRNQIPGILKRRFISLSARLSGFYSVAYSTVRSGGLSGYQSSCYSGLHGRFWGPLVYPANPPTLHRLLPRTLWFRELLRLHWRIRLRLLPPAIDRNPHHPGRKMIA